MSIASDYKLKQLGIRVEQLEKLIADMVTAAAQGKGNGSIPPEPADKRTNDWKRWHEQFGVRA